jgi:proteasome accessory factor C
VRAQMADESSAELLARARRAVTDHRRVHLRYLVPARDEATERDVDPMRVVGLDGRWYLEGWCHRAEDTRMFRMDRVEELTVLDVDGTPPAGARERDLSEGTFRPGPDDLVVTLRLLPGATWVADYYPVESVDEVPAADGGGLVVRVRTADTAWLCRLVWRLGGRGSVLEPPHVVAEVAAGASAALAAYPAAGMQE